MAATQAAEAVPDRIASLVYVSALLPADGQAMADLPPRPADDPVTSYRVVDESSGTFSFAPHAVRQIFYNDCPPAVADWAAARLEPESLRVAEGRVDLSGGRGSRVPRVYIECLRDRSITLERQRAMHTLVPCDRVLQLHADHSPFLSRPLELSRHLLSIAAEL